MVYVQLTTRCNMHCAHCCYDCGPDGYDMDEDTFRKTIEFIKDLSLTSGRRHNITIAGGEPTIHPQFEYFMKTLFREKPIIGADVDFRYKRLGRVQIFTNGKLRREAEFVKMLARKQLAVVNLSLDEYHEPIDEDFVDQWKQLAATNDYFGISDNSKTLAPFGRALKNHLWNTPWACLYDALFITPAGEIFSCGCQTESFGTVFDPCVPPSRFVPGKIDRMAKTLDFRKKVDALIRSMPIVTDFYNESLF